MGERQLQVADRSGPFGAPGFVWFVFARGLKEQELLFDFSDVVYQGFIHW